VTYALLVVAVALRIVTGFATGPKYAGTRASARNLQTVSGWYLAAFMLDARLFVTALSSTGCGKSVVTWASPFSLLTTSGATAQLPFSLLGVGAFLFHVGVYTRLAALAYLAKAQIRRLSYAGALVGTTILATIALALCGAHLVR
jgi:hypothetical protein